MSANSFILAGMGIGGVIVQGASSVQDSQYEKQAHPLATPFY